MRGFGVLVAKLILFGGVTGVAGLIAVKVAGTQIPYGCSTVQNTHCT